MSSDEELIAAYRASPSGEMLDELVRRHLRRVRALVFQMVLDDAAADDLTQEVFLRVFKDKQVLLEEIERFEGRVAWIAETRDQVRIGLAPDDGATTPDARRLAVRLVVTRRTADSVRQPVWTVDVISHHEQLVHLSGPAEPGRN